MLQDFPGPKKASRHLAPGSLSRQSTGDATATTAETMAEDVGVPAVAGSVWNLSQRHKGCRLVQQALENCGEAERAMLAQVGWDMVGYGG